MIIPSSTFFRPSGQPDTDGGRHDGYLMPEVTAREHDNAHNEEIAEGGRGEQLFSFQAPYVEKREWVIERKEK